ncbi:DoxX family protein [Rhodococcus sp. SGAir0479]|uniref:DoxX family protein n=1 Tax=Rhodococcus sp. SGAir0479 TaxID=2567884 RepID=UPI0010CD0BB4|nr:DoxX family protein [Rhodococcus sp. SGAir0479]QCQ91848.1 DoxX family protein [Rhodococcus sp. SGAir0479]
MTDKPKDHTESVGGASAPSPFDQPTERFPVQPARRTEPVVPRTDEDLDFGTAHADSLPTERIPTFRAAPAAPPPVHEQPTEVLRRDEATDALRRDEATEALRRDEATEVLRREDRTTAPPTRVQPAAPEPAVTEPPVSEPIGGAGAAPVVVPPAAAPAETDSRRGTLDVGLLILRLAVGGTLLAHGLQKLTGWWNGPGLDGYRDQLVDAGFDHARVLATAGAVAEVAGGALLILGLLTPFAAAAVLAVMINAWCLKQSAVPGLEYFAPDGIEYETLLAAAAAALVLTGPGRIALDGRRRWATRPHVGSAVVLVAGIAVGVCVWIFLNGANPVI